MGAVEMPSGGWLAGLGRFNFLLAQDQPVLDGNTFDEAEITGPTAVLAPQLEAPAEESISSTIE